MSDMRGDSCKQSPSSTEHFLQNWRVMRILVAPVILAYNVTMITLLSIIIWHNDNHDWHLMSSVPSLRWPLTSTYCLALDEWIRIIPDHDFTESGERISPSGGPASDWWWTLWDNAMVNIKMRVQQFIFTLSGQPHTTDLYCRLEN